MIVGGDEAWVTILVSVNRYPGSRSLEHQTLILLWFFVKEERLVDFLLVFPRSAVARIGNRGVSCGLDGKGSFRTSYFRLVPLPQAVPNQVCFQCDVCCRFPEPHSFLRPYFTAQEIQQAITRWVDPAHFSDPNGCQISVLSH